MTPSPPTSTATPAPDYAALLAEARIPVSPNLAPGPQYAADKRLFQGIPGIERSPGGRLWATWYSGGQGESCFNYVLLASSLDNGETWSDPVLVIDPPGKVRACDECIWLDPNGRLWLFWMQAHTLHDGKWGVWAIVTENPDVERPTWSAPRRLADGVLLNKPTVLRNGEWLFPISFIGSKMVANEKRMLPKCFQTGILERMTGEQLRALDDHFRAAVFISVDHGRTLVERGAAITPEEFRNHNEHMVVERRDGSLWMLVRTSYGIGSSVSADGGRTWSPVTPSVLPHTSSRFFLRRLRSGNLLLVKHGPISPTDAAGNPTVVKRNLLTAYLSMDDGLNWTGGLLLEERGCSYPDGTQAPDGTIYITYDLARRKEKMILMARFTEEDILAGRWVAPGSRPQLLINQATGVITEAESWDRLREQDGTREKLIYTGI